MPNEAEKPLSEADRARQMLGALDGVTWEQGLVYLSTASQIFLCRVMRCNPESNKPAAERFAKGFAEISAAYMAEVLENEMAKEQPS